MTLWHKKKNHYPPRWISFPLYGPHTIPLGYYNFPRSANKIYFFDEISASGKIFQFN